MYTGDLAFLKKIYPAAKTCVEYFKKYSRKDGLLINVYDKWNLVDWPQNMRDDYDFDLSKPVADGCHNVINAFYIGALQALEKINDILKLNMRIPCHLLLKPIKIHFIAQLPDYLLTRRVQPILLCTQMHSHYILIFAIVLNRNQSSILLKKKDFPAAYICHILC
jgi:hypothetical protein